MSEPDVRPLPATRARPPAVARWGHDVASLCPRCLKSIPGRVVSSGRGVVMRKTCPEHGDFECIVATDVAAYERMRHAPRFVERPARTSTVEAKGCPDDCGLCPAHDQHTCLAIVELTTRCNLPCPVCLADARAQGADLSAEEVLEALRRLLETEGQPVPLQFAGGRYFASIDVLASRVKLRARALHEGDLLGFIDDLTRTPQGFYPVDKCIIRRVEAPADTIQPRVEAECTLEWITLREKRGATRG